MAEVPQRSSIRVVLLSDGIAGHFRQSEGVVAALARRFDVVVDRIELRHRSPLWRLVSDFLVRYVPTLLPPGWLLGPTGTTLPPPDVIVSAGGRTLAAHVVLARSYPKARTVFSGTPKRFGAKAFDLVLLSYPAPRTNGLYVLKPTALDPGRHHVVADPREPRRYGVLVGGPTRWAGTTEAEFARLVEVLEEMATAGTTRFVVVTSRRTPEAWRAMVLARLAPLAACEVIDFATAGPGSIAAAYDTEALLITADSMSMICEGVALAKPVIVLTPASVRPHRDDATRADLVRAKRIVELPYSGLTGEAVASGLTLAQPMDQNHLDVLGDLLTRELGLPAASLRRREPPTP
jgi:mitochondrial fission protein ELM1